MERQLRPPGDLRLHRFFRDTAHPSTERRPAFHKGADFRAAAGTPVYAANDGVVLIARPMFYEGNFVLIDHGQQLMSMYLHFSRIDVRAGETVRKGQQLGLSGATGRVTGPHLHFAVRWQGDYLDPVKLLALRLPSFRPSS